MLFVPCDEGVFWGYAATASTFLLPAQHKVAVKLHVISQAVIADKSDFCREQIRS